MNPDSNPPVGPSATSGTSLTSEHRSKLASELSQAENGKRLILSVLAVLPAAFLATLFGAGLLGGVVFYGGMLYLLWRVHRRLIQKHYLKASDMELLYEHSTRRPTTALALGCLGGTVAGMVALVLCIVFLGIVLAAMSPDEQKMRSAVFGQLGKGLEQLGDFSGKVGGPKIVYTDYVFGSVLAIEYSNGAEPNILAFGVCGRVWVTDDVKKIHELSAPLSR